ncbi:hypothetical protein ACJJTC_006196 [Scirpophaga incertulas]
MPSVSCLHFSTLLSLYRQPEMRDTLVYEMLSQYISNIGEWEKLVFRCTCRKDAAGAARRHGLWIGKVEIRCVSPDDLSGDAPHACAPPKVMRGNTACVHNAVSRVTTAHRDTSMR